MQSVLTEIALAAVGAGSRDGRAQGSDGRVVGVLDHEPGPAVARYVEQRRDGDRVT